MKGDRTGRALLVVDEQVDFCEGGALAVIGGNSVCEDTAHYLEANRSSYDLVVFTRDFHVDPGAHFAKGKVGEEGAPDFVDTWPRHCVAGTEGAEFHPAIREFVPDVVVSKGQTSAAYSGFEGMVDDENALTLGEYLKRKGISDIDVVGLAFDYCVKATALDAAREGFRVVVLQGLTAAVNKEAAPGTRAELVNAGVIVADAGTLTWPSRPPTLDGR